MYDESVTVRTVAIEGIFRVLNAYWEMLPDEIIRVLLSRLVNDIAFDTASSNIRLAVLQGFQYLLDNHLAQPILKGNLMVWLAYFR